MVVVFRECAWLVNEILERVGCKDKKFRGKNAGNKEQRYLHLN